MLHSISWSSYWTAILAVVICYYGYIAWLNRSRLFKSRPAIHAELPSLDDLHHLKAEACNSELIAYIDQVSLTKPSKKEVLFSLHKIIQRYPSLAGTVYQNTISQWVAFDAKDKCAIYLSDEDLREVWLV